MPVLDLPLGVGCGEDVSRFVVIVFRSPQNVRERGLVFTRNRKRQIFLLGVEHLDSAILASYINTANTCSDVLVLRIKFDGMDLDLRFPLGEEMGNIDVRVGNQFYSG